MASQNNLPINVVANTSPFLSGVQQATSRVTSRPVTLNVQAPALGKISSDLTQFNKSLDAAVARVISFTATTRIIGGIGNAFAAVTKSAIDVEQAMTRISSILGTTASETKEVQASLFKIANQTSTSFYTVAEAAEEFSRQGYSLNKTLEATRAAAVLAKLSGGDLGKTIEGLTAIISTSTNEALEFVDVANKLTAVDAKFATSGTGLIEGLKRFGGVARENGLILDEQIGILASIKQLTGRSEAVLGNSIKSILTSFGSEKVQKDLESIGVTVKDNNGEFKNAVEVGRELATVFQTLNDTQKEFIKQRVAGKYQANAFQGFIDSFTPGANGQTLVDKAINTSKNSDNDSDKRLDKLNQSTASAIERFKNNIISAGADIGERLTKPIVDNVIEKVGVLADALSAKLKVPFSDAGTSLGKILASGLGNVLGGPGLIAIGVIVSKFMFKILGDSRNALQSLLGIQKIKGQITAQDQVAVTEIYPKINEADLRRIANLTTVAAKEQAILNILNQQLRVTEALGFTNAFLPTIKGVSPTRPRYSKAGGSIPDAVLRESSDIKKGVGGARPNAVPQLKMLNLGKGLEPVVVNSDEKIVKNYANSGQDAVLNRHMQGYAIGHIPNAAGGVSPRIAGLLAQLGYSPQQVARMTAAQAQAAINTGRTAPRSGAQRVQNPYGRPTPQPLNLTPPPPVAPRVPPGVTPPSIGPVPPPAPPTPPRQPLPQPAIAVRNAAFAANLNQQRAAQAQAQAAKQEALQKKAERREIRAGRLATAGFAISFAGGALAETLRGPKGESTAAQRLTESGTSAAGIAATFGAINPVAGIVAGVAGGISLLSDAFKEAKVPLDGVIKSQNDLVESTNQQMKALDDYAGGIADLNQALATGSKYAQELAQEKISTALGGISDEGLLKRLNDAKKDPVKLQSIISEQEQFNKANVEQGEVVKAFTEYKRKGLFAPHRNRSITQFGGFTENSDNIADSILSGVGANDISPELKAKLDKKEEIKLDDIRKYIKNEGLLSAFESNGQDLGATGLHLERGLRRRLYGAEVGKDVVNTQLDSTKFFEVLQDSISDASTKQKLESEKLQASLELLNKQIELSTDKFTDLETAQINYQSEVNKIQTELATVRNDMRSRFLSEAEGILKRTTLTATNQPIAERAIKNFAANGDFAAFKSEIQKAIGAGSTKDLEELARQLVEEAKLANGKADISTELQKQIRDKTIENIRQKNAQNLYGGSRDFADSLKTSTEGLRAYLQPKLENKVATQYISPNGIRSDINQNAFANRSLAITRGNRDRALTVLQGIQAEQESGLFDLPNASAAGDRFLKFKRQQAFEAFRNKRNADIIEETGAQVPEFVNGINQRYKKVTGGAVPLINKEQLAGIQRSVATGDFGSAQDQLSELRRQSDLRGDNFSEIRGLFQNLQDFVGSRKDFFDSTESAAGAFADKTVKGSTGQQIINQLEAMNKKQEEANAFLGNIAGATGARGAGVKAAIISQDRKNKLSEIESNKAEMRRLDTEANSLPKTAINKQRIQNLEDQGYQLYKKNELLQKGVKDDEKKLAEPILNEVKGALNKLNTSIDALKEPFTKLTGNSGTNPVTSAVDVTVNIANALNSPDFLARVGQMIVSELYDLTGKSLKVKPTAK